MSYIRSVILNELGGYLTRVYQAIINPPWLDKTANQIRAQITGTISTVTTVSSMTTFLMDGYQARVLGLGSNQTAWTQCVRSRIT